MIGSSHVSPFVPTYLAAVSSTFIDCRMIVCLNETARTLETVWCSGWKKGPRASSSHKRVSCSPDAVACATHVKKLATQVVVVTGRSPG